MYRGVKILLLRQQGSPEQLPGTAPLRPTHDLSSTNATFGSSPITKRFVSGYFLHSE
jgi:hypothetical protein